MLKFYNHKPTKGYEQTPLPDEKNSTVVTSQEFNKADAAKLVEKFGLAQHLLDDVFDMNELPRIEIENNYKYVFLRNFTTRGSKASTFPVLFVVNGNFFACLSVNKQPTTDLVDLASSDKELPSSQKMLTKGIFAITQRYEEFIDQIGNTITTTERRMRGHEATNQDFFGFVSIEGSLNRAAMNLTGLSSVVEKLMINESNKNAREKLDDVHLFSKQLLVEISSHLQSIKSIREAYSTVASNTLNQRMKILTTLTLLVALPNVFYGMYGMNVKLPFMDEPWAYSAVVLFTLLVIVVVYAIARHKRFF